MFKKSSELSSSIEQVFKPDIITQFGFSGNLTAIAYDPVQSLFAIGTDTGLIHVMGGGEIRAVFDPNPKHKTMSAPIVHLRFVTSVYLVAIDDKSYITVWALDTRQEWANYQCPYSVMCCFTDPSMDWLIMGHNNGETTAFDIDRGMPVPFRINNLERLVNPKFSTGSVINVQLHPRDPSMLLLVYRDLAVVWNIAKGEIMFDIHYEFPIYTAVWHPSGSHIASSHVNGLIVFWDGQKGVRLGARPAFPANVDDLELNSTRVPEGMVWCSKDDPINTFLLVWGGHSARIIEFGTTPTVATSSYESMGNFYKNPNAQEHEIQLKANIKLLQILPQSGQPHFLGAYNPSHAVILAEDNQLLTVALPNLYTLQQDATVLPPAMSWRASNITSLSTAAITRNQWIGMMAAAMPNTKVTGGNSATQQIRKLQLATVMCVGFGNGIVKLFDGTRADSRDYRVVCISTVGLDPEKPVDSISRVSVGTEVGELSIATSSGNIFLATFGKNKRLQKPGPPAPTPDLQNVEHRVAAEFSQGYIPQWLFKGNSPTSSLCNSNIGFVGVGFENGRLVVIDKRGPALIMDVTIKGTATYIEFGILAIGEDPYSSIIMSVGTSRGDVLIYRVLPRPQGGYQINTGPKDVIQLNVGKEPVKYLAHIDTKEGRPAQALPEVMSRLASGLVVVGAILASTFEDAKFFQITGPKVGKKTGAKNFDTPVIASTYAYLRWGSSNAYVSVNPRGKLGIYGLPGLGTLCTYPLPFPPVGKGMTISEMGDAFVPYDTETHAGQIVRVFGTDQIPKDDDVYQLKRRVPGRPQISTAHWIAGRQFYKPSDIDEIIGGKRRGKSRRNRKQLVDETISEPQVGTSAAAPERPSSSKQGNSWFGGRSVPTFSHPVQHHHSPPKKSWGKTFNDYYETAEDTVNEALDEALGQVKTGKSSAQSSAMRGVIGSKFGF